MGTVRDSQLRGAIFRIGRGLGVGLLLAVAGTLGGCGPPTQNVLTGSNGESIRLSVIQQIVTNSEFTNEQKRQELAKLGITDPDMIELLTSEGVIDTLAGL